MVWRMSWQGFVKVGMRVLKVASKYSRNCDTWMISSSVSLCGSIVKRTISPTLISLVDLFMLVSRDI